MRAVLLLASVGVICVTLATGTSVCCSCSLLFAAGERSWFSYSKCCAAPRKGDPSACGYQRAGTQGTGTDMSFG